MIWENTKLLLQLLYRPVSAMSRIVDEGHWLYAAIAVVILSMAYQSSVTSHIYSAYEAVYREVEQSQRRNPAIINQTVGRHRPPSPGNPDTDYEEEGDSEADSTPYVFERHPLPIVGDRAWWFVSFAPVSFLSTVMGMAVLYVPCLILMVAISGSNGTFGLLLRRDYGPLLTCGLMAWAAGHLPATLAGFALASPGPGAKTALGLWTFSALFFGLLMSTGLRTLFGISYQKALILVTVASLSFSVQSRLFAAISPFLFSPFLLFYAYYMFRGDIGDIGFSLRQRQGFRRSMEAATINPRDASAHYQLGLIYQYRRQYTEALSRFQRAIEIDNDETDAHFQLGRIAREQGRLQDAINYFSTVIEQDDKHAQNEIWREVGATYLAAAMFEEAKNALETFLERRAYDPEGLYYYGETLERLGEQASAREAFSRCVEAVKTMPSYRYRENRKWDKLARDRLTSRRQRTT